MNNFKNTKSQFIFATPFGVATHSLRSPVLGDTVDDILSLFQLIYEQSANYYIVKTRFDKSVRKNVNYKQAVFNKRYQKNLLMSLFYHCIVW